MKTKSNADIVIQHVLVTERILLGAQVLVMPASEISNLLHSDTL